MSGLTHKIAAKAEDFHRRLGARGEVAWALLMVVWGITSGISLKRDYAHSRQLIGYLLLFLLISILSRIWLNVNSRFVASRESQTFLKLLHRNPKIVTATTDFAIQYAVQYIMMFCIPLLFMAQSWLLLAGAVAITAFVMIDRLWRRLVSWPIAVALVRAFASFLAASYAFPVFFPQYLEYYTTFVCTIAVLGALPFAFILERRLPRLSEIYPSVMLVLIVTLTPKTRLPILSLWLSDPAIGLGIEQRELKQRWKREISHAEWSEALQDGREICCRTPVTTPSGVESPVTHEWVIDGQVVDRIEVGPIRAIAKNGEKAFRTYTCKRYFDAPEFVKDLECRVYLQHHLYLGRIKIKILPAEEGVDD